MFYLVDDPATMLALQIDGQAITACATGPVALDLRTLPRGAMICASMGSILESIDSGVLTLDNDRQVMTINRAAQVLLDCGNAGAGENPW